MKLILLSLQSFLIGSCFLCTRMNLLFSSILLILGTLLLAHWLYRIIYIYIYIYISNKSYTPPPLNLHTSPFKQILRTSLSFKLFSHTLRYAFYAPLVLKFLHTSTWRTYHLFSRDLFRA